MHIIAIQKRVLTRTLGRAQSLQRLVESQAPQPGAPARSRGLRATPLAWLPTYARRMRDLFDGRSFPYGIEENRPTWWQLLRLTPTEQGIAHFARKAGGDFPRYHDVGAGMSSAEEWVSFSPKPILRRVAMGFADQIGQESDLIALPSLRIACMEITLLLAAAVITLTDVL